MSMLLEYEKRLECGMRMDFPDEVSSLEFERDEIVEQINPSMRFKEGEFFPNLMFDILAE